MRKSMLALVALLLFGAVFAPRARALPTLDKYGARTDITCSGGAKGYFYTQKVGTKWYFCDALGNAFISMNVGAITPNNSTDCFGANSNTIQTAKYGDLNYNWAWQTLKRMVSWNFNSTGQDSVGEVNPWYTCSNCVWPGGAQPVPMPYIFEDKPAEYAASNTQVNNVTILTSAIKDMLVGTNSNYTAWRGASLYDIFDPGLSTWYQADLANTNNPYIVKLRANDPWLLGVFTDDSDYFWGSGAGPDFNEGHTNANIAWITLLTAPAQTYIQASAFGDKTLLYTTTKNYTKSQATNPSTTCSVTNPCSLRDYLWQKYSGSISALNAAWGSNYTTFDSTGTQVTGESIGTGNGTQTVFTHTLAHTPVSPYSVLIFVGGTPEIGDCPWFVSDCGISTSNEGTLGSPMASYITQSSSTINYSTGALTITFVTAPANGAAITVSYIYGGWMAGGTGLMDESGGTGSMTGCPGSGTSTCWVGTNPYCLEGADPNYPTYFACVGGGGSNEPVPNANPHFGADLDNWIPQYAAEYFKTIRTDFKAVTNVPYLGLDTIGSWGTPSYSKFLEGASPYLDGMFTQLVYSGLNPAPTAFESAYQYTTRYLGDVPLLDFLTLIAEADSSMSCYSQPAFEDFATQALRGQEYYNTVNYLLTTPGYNGTIPFIGFDWWAWQDFQDSNQGLVSSRDNAYDGSESVSGTVTCDSSYTSATSCGGEKTNYGNQFSATQAITNANLIWLTGARTQPTAISKKAFLALHSLHSNSSKGNK